MSSFEFPFPGRHQYPSVSQSNPIQEREVEIKVCFDKIEIFCVHFATFCHNLCPPSFQPGFFTTTMLRVGAAQLPAMTIDTVVNHEVGGPQVQTSLEY